MILNRLLKAINRNEKLIIACIGFLTSIILMFIVALICLGLLIVIAQAYMGG